MDNLAVHRSNEIKQRLDELSIPFIFGPPYSPDYNPIESVFSIFKREMKVKRLKAIVNGKHFKTKDNIRQIFENINVLKIVNCINHVEILFKK